METPYLLSFDLFQQIVDWLSASTRSYRKGRYYLENNQALLQQESDKELERLITAHDEDRIEIKQEMYSHLALLRDARVRGNTTDSIREAYVNIFGGFALILPAWLEEIEQQLIFLVGLHRPERTYRRQEKLLRRALDKSSRDSNIAAEVSAELQNKLGYLLAQSSHYATQQERLQAFETAIHCHKAALRVFTAYHYPLQYARTCMYLGYTYQRYSTIGHNNFQEHAISCYNAASRIYTEKDSPEQWANIQTALGKAYSQHTTGSMEENFNIAIAYHNSALQSIHKNTFPRSWATIHIDLGDTYMRQGNKGNGYYREQAMSCYRAALSIYTMYDFPKEWADIHMRLAVIFQGNAEAHLARRDIYLRCAIVCNEAALQFYALESFPVEYAAAHVNLGHLHLIRTEGNQIANLEQACRCYRNALHIFTRQAFPEECNLILSNLSQAENKREALTQRAETLTQTPTRV